ncbi:MAG: hypothetical protein KBS79_05025, partial [Lachnospiraceae bacterium]|nr:hypothetical protein [Candidatus Minthocola equi]
MIKSFKQKISIMLIVSMLVCSCPVNAFADEIIQENPDSGMATISETASVSELDEYDDSSESDADYAVAFKPAFEMSSDPIDGAIITVSAEEGVFPEGAQLVVKKINQDAKEMTDIESAIDNYNT